MIILVYNKDTDLYIPGIFMLMSHKNERSYTIALEYMKSLIFPINRNIKFTVDFEKALVNAIKKTFDCEVIGCKTHLSAALHRKAGKMKLMTEVKLETESIIKNFLASLETDTQTLHEYLDEQTKKYENESKDSSLNEG